MIAPELMDHIAIPYNWQEFVFHRGCSFNLSSFLETGLIAGKKAKKEDIPSSSHLSTLLGKIPMNKNRAMSSRDQEKCTMSVIGNMFRTPSFG